MKNNIGKRFGNLVIVSQEQSSKDGMSRWLCQCDCGNKHITRLRNLKNGDCKSCGCLKLTRYGEISGSFFWAIRNNAKTRDIPFEITIEEAWKQFENQKGKCAISGVEISLCKDHRQYKFQTASLDRIDSNGHYTLGNIQWIHKELNVMKMAMPEEKFLNWVKKIYEFKSSDQFNSLEESNCQPKQRQPL